MTNKNALRSALVLVTTAIATPAAAEVVLASGSRVVRDYASPLPVTTFTRDQIEGIEELDVGSVLDNMLSQGGPIRGSGTASLNTSGFAPGQTLVLIDGTRVPDQAIASDFPGFAIERIEIMKGTLGSMYGRGTGAGIINIVTRDSIDPVDAGHAFTTGMAQSLLGRTFLSVQSNQYCDATNGNLARPWEWSSSWEAPSGGSLFAEWNMQSTEEFLRKVDEFLSDEEPSYTQLQSIISRIDGESSLTPQQQAVLKSRLILGSTMAPGFFSDDAVDAGLFDPTRTYQQLLAGTTAIGGSGEVDASRPGNVTWGPGEVAPFDTFPYPAASEFDFSLCSAEQRDEILQLIGRRDSHRVNRSVITSPLLYDDVSDATYEQIMSDAQAEEDSRDEVNRALKAYWLSCVAPQTESGTAAVDDAAPAADSPTDDTTAQESADTTATAARDTASADPMDEIIITANPAVRSGSGSSASADPADAGGEYDFSAGQWKSWSLDVRYYRNRFDDDGNETREGVEDLVVGVHPRRFDSKFGAPFTYNGNRDTETGHNQSPWKGFTNSNGVVTFDGLMSPGSFGQSRPDADAGDPQADDDAERQRILDAFLNSHPPMPAGPFGMAFGYEHRREDYDADPFVSGSRSRTDERDAWNYDLSVDYFGGGSGPRIRAQFPIEQADGIFQVFPGMGGVGKGFQDLPERTRNTIPDGFTIGGSYSLNDKFVLNYSYDQNKGLDLGQLNNVDGQGGWGNDFCGDKALPPQDVGYASAAMSPVKTVDDRWALAHVGLGENLLPDSGEPVIVGIIDTGLDWNHLDFAWDNLWRNDDEIPDNGIDDDNNGYVDDVIGWDFMADNNAPWDYDGHGTFVAGLVAATHGNDAGIDGANPNAKIMVLKALNNHGRTRASYIARAIIYGVDNGARILNLSVSGPGFPRIVQDAVDYAVSKGVLVVMAAGNRAEDVDRARPAPLRGVMTVAATGADEKRAAFSNVGSALNVAAPGVDVVSLRARVTDMMHNSAASSYVPGDAYLGDDNRYYRATGTSFSSAIVSGVASVVLSARPELTLAELKRVLEQSARDVETPGRDRFTGYGIVDAQAALDADPAFFIHADIPDVRRLDADGQVFLQVVGVADADQFQRATLDIGQGEAPESWTATGPVLLERLPLGELGRIPAEELAAAQTWTVRLTVEHVNGQKREAHYVVELR